MKTYCITSEFIYHISTEIHAESEEEAKRLFEDLSMEQIVGANIYSSGRFRRWTRRWDTRR